MFTLDKEKLFWMNGKYIRETNREKIFDLVKKDLKNKGYDLHLYDEKWLSGIISLEIERCKTISEFEGHLSYFLKDEFTYEEKGVKKIFLKKGSLDILEFLKTSLSFLKDFKVEELEKNLRLLAEKKNLSFGKLVHPLRLALTGRTATPGIFEVLHYIGKERTLKRIEKAISYIKNLREL